MRDAIGHADVLGVQLPLRPPPKIIREKGITMDKAPKLCPFCHGSHHLADDCAPKQVAHVDEADRPFVVCPTCKGHGHHGPGHVYTMDELDERFGPDVNEVMQDYRDGKYDVTCTECKGARVVKDECACPDCEREREYEREAAAEAAYFARMGM